MEEFKEYLRFPDIQKASEFTLVLEKHNIPFQLDDTSMRFKVIATNDPWDKQFILKLKESDIERAEATFDKELDVELKNTSPEHYLYSFSDKDILDVIANQNDWTKSEVKLSLKIAADRKMDLSAQSIKRAKKIPEAKVDVPKISTIENASAWFWVIGVFSIVNTIFLIKDINFRLPGLAISELFDTVFHKLAGVNNNIGFVFSLLIASLMFVFARFGKKNNKLGFLIGVIFYSLDGILAIISKSYGNIFIHFLVLWMAVTALINSNNESESNRQSGIE